MGDLAAAKLRRGPRRAARRDHCRHGPRPLGGIRAGCAGTTAWSSTAAAVEQAALALGIDVDPATPYAPHEKGKIERLHGTITETFVVGLPGQLEAPGAPLALGELVERFDAWVRAYNTGRPHRSLAGRTPLERLHVARRRERFVKSLLG